MLENCITTCGICPSKLRFDIHVHTTYFKQEDKLLSILTDQDGAWSKSNPCKDGKRNLVCNNPAPLGDGAYCNGLAIEDC